MKDLNSDFQEFTNSNQSPPAELSQRILLPVCGDLKPSALRVFVKVLAIHSVVSLLTLSLCSQFGIRLFGEGPGLMAHLMSFGEMGCMAVCGGLFLGATAIATGLLLSQPESRRLIREWPMHAALLLGFSIAFFASVDATLTLEALSVWSLSGLVVAYALLRGAHSLRASFGARQFS